MNVPIARPRKMINGEKCIRIDAAKIRLPPWQTHDASKKDLWKGDMYFCRSEEIILAMRPDLEDRLYEQIAWLLQQKNGSAHCIEAEDEIFHFANNYISDRWTEEKLKETMESAAQKEFLNLSTRCWKRGVQHLKPFLLDDVDWRSLQQVEEICRQKMTVRSDDKDVSFDVCGALQKPLHGRVIFRVRDENGKAVVAKVNYAESIPMLTSRECRALKAALNSGIKNISEFLMEGTDHFTGKRAILMSVSTATVSAKVVQECLGNFQKEDLVRIEEILMPTLKSIHAIGWTHQSIDPTNILIDFGQKPFGVILSGFDLAAPLHRMSMYLHAVNIYQPKRQTFFEYRQDVYEPSMLDDFESLRYSTVDLHEGSLPWSTYDIDRQLEAKYEFWEKVKFDETDGSMKVFWVALQNSILREEAEKYRTRAHRV